MIIGPEGTAFAGRIISLKIFCSNDYPMKAPQVSFNNKVNMKCVNNNGNI
jgi:ubiquitin-protein ligase